MPAPRRPFRRVVLIVLDSVGIGEMPDAAAFGDAGSDTLGHVAASRPLRIPTLVQLGLAIHFLLRTDEATSRRLFRFTLVYLPALLGLLLVVPLGFPRMM